MSGGLRPSRREGGFTLVEALVAVAVLLVAVVGPLSLASQALFAASLSQSQITGVFLAQEAVEFVRNVRDENILHGRSWDAGLSPCMSACQIDVPKGTINACGASCAPIRFNDATGLYGYGGSPDWEETPFTREVSVRSVSADEMEVVSTISWNHGRAERSFTVRDHLFNWQE